MSAKLTPIKDVAAQLSVMPQMIRQWECKYALISSVRSATGERLYSAEEVEKMSQIKALLSSGISIESVKENWTTPGSH